MFLLHIDNKLLMQTVANTVVPVYGGGVLHLATVTSHMQAPIHSPLRSDVVRNYLASDANWHRWR
jgi:hypothetical protein